MAQVIRIHMKAVIVQEKDQTSARKGCAILSSGGALGDRAWTVVSEHPERSNKRRPRANTRFIASPSAPTGFGPIAPDE